MAVTGVITAAMTICLVAGVPLVTVIAAFGLLSSLLATVLGFFLYKEVAEVKKNTNGSASQAALYQQQLTNDYIEFLKKSPPVKSE